MKVTASAPTFDQNTRVLSLTDGQRGPANGWEGAVRNDGTTARYFKVGVNCAGPIPGMTALVSSGQVASGSFNALRINCPTGMSALGGGVDLNSVMTMRVTSSAPAFAQNNNRLIFQPNGPNPGAVGWQASAKNDATSGQLMRAVVICAPNFATSTVVASASPLTPGGAGAARVNCPAGRAALGGGIDVENVLTMTVTSSGPTFAPNNTGLMSQADGQIPVAVGWQASSLNNDPSPQPFKVAVICDS
jgi:hypothetical protein